MRNTLNNLNVDNYFFDNSSLNSSNNNLKLLDISDNLLSKNININNIKDTNNFLNINNSSNYTNSLNEIEYFSDLTNFNSNLKINSQFQPSIRAIRN
jgi:hypothetical protein